MALTPLVLFLAVYLSVSIVTGDFYKMPLSVAFLFSAIYAVLITRLPYAQRIEHFSTGASNANVLLMIWIFVMAVAL